ncbi:MAG: hypothetical protein MJ252_15105 [archaeon]|nr:hypothetical protein [archaeon]
MEPSLTEPKDSSESKGPSMRYSLSPEEMWDYMNGSGDKGFGIPGYNVPRKFFDYHQAKWVKEREEILKGHKRQWPPKDWPREKGGDKQVPPQRLNFIDETIKLANSFNDPAKSAELKEKLAKAFDYPKPREIPDARGKFLEDQKKKEERLKAMPKIYEWRAKAIEDATNRRDEAEKNKKTKTERDLEKYKGKASWPRCDRVSIMADAEYVGEQLPFYKSPQKEGEKIEKLFFPNVK